MTQNTPENPYDKQQTQQAQQYGQPAYANAPYGAPAEDPGKTLGIIGLVLCFVFALAGLIVSIIAKKKSTEAGFTNTPANVGVILGWIFTILGTLVAIFYVIAFVVLLNNGVTTTTY
ncbi:DUF4190 domain-containing protein [Arthrobacter sp. TMN-49]